MIFITNLLIYNEIAIFRAANLTHECKKELIDSFGKLVIEEVRDRVLTSAMAKATLETVNPVKREQYEALNGLSEKQCEAVCDLLSETHLSTVYDFIHMFEDYSNQFAISVKRDGRQYDLIEIWEEPGSDICFHQDGWIQRFSKVGRFVI